MTDSELLASAQAWHDQDPDPETRGELAELISAAEAGADSAVAQLHDRFDTRLAFGTAGLRGELAAGSNRMNRVLVTQTAGGLAAYLQENAGVGDPSVVIGYDGRKNSDVFARDTAELMVGAGVRAVLLPRMLPTPVLAFAVRHLNVSAGVMVTASHNPPRDNGYKVYLGDNDHGSQIVPPADAEIAEHILRIARTSIAELPRSVSYEIADESVIDAYVDATAAVCAPFQTDAANTGEPLRVVYTAMHGVGWESASRVFTAAGFPTPHVVSEQINPDPEFSTVDFPNPEEPGAMDLSFAYAREVDAELIIANDPDADRLAIAIPDPTSPEGFTKLSGNEVGTLLGWIAAENATSAGQHGTLAASCVSSPALQAVASAYGLDYADTLTGFKWVSRVDNLLYGFEEALGYLVNPDTVRDKDGISAAVLFLAHATALKEKGQSVADRLDAFSAQFGHFASDQISLRVSDVSKISAIMARLREDPPAMIGPVAITRIEDLKDGFDSLPPSNVLRILLDDGSRVMVRPSGTEPKLKVYIDAQSTDDTLTQRREAAQKRVAEIGDGMRSLIS